MFIKTFEKCLKNNKKRQGKEKEREKERTYFKRKKRNSAVISKTNGRKYVLKRRKYVVKEQK